MSARLLADEDVDVAICDCLRGYGHSVTHVNDMKEDAREAGPDDDDVLSCAEADERAVLTCNFRDFEKLHEQGVRHFGIIGCPAQLDPRETARSIDDAIGTALAGGGTLFRQCLRVKTTTRRKRRARKRRK